MKKPRLDIIQVSAFEALASNVLNLTIRYACIHPTGLWFWGRHPPKSSVVDKRACRTYMIAFTVIACRDSSCKV